MAQRRFRRRRGSRWRDCELEPKPVGVRLVPGGNAFPPSLCPLAPLRRGFFCVGCSVLNRRPARLRYDPNRDVIEAGKQMAAYHFGIKSTKRIEDLGAMDLANDAEALAFGRRIIRDLMDGAAKQYAHWTME